MITGVSKTEITKKKDLNTWVIAAEPRPQNTPTSEIFRKHDNQPSGGSVSNTTTTVTNDTASNFWDVLTEVVDSAGDLASEFVDASGDVVKQVVDWGVKWPENK